MVLSREFRRRVLELPDRRYAIIDGAYLRDPVRALAARSFEPVSLFRDLKGTDVERAGPWLIPVNDEHALETFGEIAAGIEAPWAVFWSSPGEHDELMRHLRKINLVMLPEPGTAKHAPAMFRHWDPEALAPVLSVLSGPQRRRLLGPANAILFEAPDFGGIIEHARTADPVGVSYG